MYHSPVYLVPKPKQLLSRYDRWRERAKLVGLTDKAKLRLEWIIFHETVAAKKGSVTTAHFSLKKSTFYYWYKRFDEKNLKSLEDESSTPKTKRSFSPNPLVLERMIQLKKQFRHWGKMKLAPVYEQLYGEHIAPWQFQRVIQEFHLQRPRKSHRYRRNGAKKQWLSLEARQASTNLFSLDTIVLYEFGDKRYIVTAIEHTSKLAYARVYSSHASAAARDFLLRLEYLVGDSLKLVLTDNGSEFQKYFQEVCLELGIIRYYTRPRTPKDNPEAERFNRTIQEEWLNDGNWYRDIKQMNQSLTDWLILYHNLRPHQTLNYQTPLRHAITKGVWSKRSSSSTST